MGGEHWITAMVKLGLLEVKMSSCVIFTGVPSKPLKGQQVRLGRCHSWPRGSTDALSTNYYNYFLPVGLTDWSTPSQRLMEHAQIAPDAFSALWVPNSTSLTALLKNEYVISY